MPTNKEIRTELGWDLNQPYVPNHSPGPGPDAATQPAADQKNATRYVAVRDKFLKDTQGETPAITAADFDAQADRLVAEATK